MEFEKMNVPVFTGLDKLKRIDEKVDLKGGNFIISSVKLGIPCIIANGKVCDDNGVEFECAGFQEAFDWFASRVSASKSIAIGRIVSSEMKSYSKRFDFDFAWKIHSLSRVYGPEKFAEIEIIIEDFVFSLALDVPYKTRMMAVESMAKNVKMGDMVNVRLQKRLEIEKPSISEIEKFVLENARLGEMTAFYKEGYKYSRGNSNLRDLGAFYVDAFETFDAKIIEIKSTQKYDETFKKNVEVVDIISVEVDKKKGIISYANRDVHQASEVYGAIMFNEKKTVRISAVVYGGKLLYTMPI